MTYFNKYYISTLGLLNAVSFTLLGFQVSISPTFYEQFLCQNPFAKKLQTQIVTHKRCAKNFGMKKLLVKY